MRFLAVSSIALFPAVLCAGPVPFAASLRFDTLEIGEQVLNYYDGGFGSLGSGPGPINGVTFSSGLVVSATYIPPATGNYAMVNGAVTMNLDDSWSSIISFYAFGSGDVSFYAGPNGTGTLLDSYPLASAGPDLANNFGAKPGTFDSAVFTASPGSTLLVATITFGEYVLPEPPTAFLALLSMPLFSLSLLRYAR